MNGNDPLTAEVWTKINGKPGDPSQPGLLKTVMGPMRVAQQVFSTVVRGTEEAISADTIDLNTGTPTTGEKKPFATIQKLFLLYPVHVGNMSDLTVAMNQVTLAAQSLALAEDMLYFQGRNAQDRLPKEVNLPPNDIDKLKDGLLGIASRNCPIKVFPCGVFPCGDNEEKTYGVATYAAVVKGISQFRAHLQGPPYALILEPSLFGDASFPLSESAIITPASAIQAIMDKSEGHFVMSSGMPERTGLLVSLGGITTTLYVGTEPMIEYNTFEGGKYSFNARESIQFHNIDPRSLIKLEFQDSPIR